MEVHLLGPGAGRFGEGHETHLKNGALEAEIVEVGGDFPGQFGRGLGAFFREGGRGLVHLGAVFSHEGFETLQFLSAILHASEFASGLVVESLDFGEGGTVLAFQGLQQGEAFVQALQFRRVRVDLIGVILEAGLEFLQLHLGGAKALKHCGGAGVDALQIVGETGHLPKGAEQAGITVAEAVDELTADLGQAGGIGGNAMTVFQVLLLVRLELSLGDLRHLEAQQVDLLLGGALGGLQRVEIGEGITPGFPSGGVLGDSGFHASVSVQHVELALLGVEGLVVVRAMEIDEVLAEALEHLKCDGAAIDELFVGTAAGDGAFDEQFAVLAGFGAGVGQDLIDETGILEMKTSLHRAGVLAGADQGAVGALAEDELEGSDDDGLARASLASDTEQTGAELPGDVFHESEMTDFQEGEHGGEAGGRQPGRKYGRGVEGCKRTVANFERGARGKAGADERAAVSGNDCRVFSVCFSTPF